jgi:N-acetylglucosaminyldiphosphoundecaprenol N-acetyl-beta-D-mannosaminyltransferase
MTLTSAGAPVSATGGSAGDVLGVPCVNGDIASAAHAVVAMARDRQGGYACFCNVHVLMLAQGDPELREALRAARAVFPDGAPVAWLQRCHGIAGASRIAGPDLMPLVFELSQELGLRHYLLGSTEHVLRRCEQMLLRAFPAAEIVGTNSPPFADLHRRENTAVLAAIRNASPDLLWVGLGAPKQELWMRSHAHSVAPALALGVGAAFDFVAGTMPRAPAWMQRGSLEWLHRMLREPRRLGGRYLRTNSAFVIRAGLELARERSAQRLGS